MGDYLGATVKSVRRGYDTTSMILSVDHKPSSELVQWGIKRDPTYENVQYELPMGIGIRPGDKIEFYLGDVVSGGGTSFIGSFVHATVTRKGREILSFDPDRMKK